MAASRSSISFEQENWQKLQNEENKSQTVNIALRFYYSSRDRLKQAEEEFILNELVNFENTGESYSEDEVFNSN